MQAISRKQTEATIQLLKAKLAMREKYLHYTKLRATLERQLIEQFTDGMVSPGVVEQYLSAHKYQSEAMCEIEQVVIAELKSQVAIHEAMLQEGERSVVVPGSKLV
jgi:hypothetical protein